MARSRLFNEKLEIIEIRIIQDLLKNDPQDLAVNLNHLFINYGRCFVNGINITLNKLLYLKISALTIEKNRLPYTIIPKSRLLLLIRMSTLEEEIVAFGKLRHAIRTVLHTKIEYQLDRITL
jgi:hypothetical protein